MISAEELLDLTQKKGISDVEIYQVQSYSRPISFEANRLKQIESSQTTGLAIRLWQNNCPGLAVAYGEIEPEDLIHKAIAISQLNEPEEILLNSNNRLIYPASEQQPDLCSFIAQGKNAIALIREQNPEVLVNLELEWEQETTTLINSRGLYCQQTDISQSASLGVELVKEEDFLGIYDSEYTHHQLKLDSIVANVLQKLHWAEKNATIESRKVPVLFTPNAAITLWETVTEALNGKYILDHSSPWSESLGTQVISSQISLSQQPDLEPYNCPFDDEGTITQSLQLIQEGILQHIYTDQKIASKLGISNTGNGFRSSLGSYPSPDLVNLVVNCGNLSQWELIKNLSTGIVIEQILGGGADISGDFSFNIDLGYVIKNGQIIGRIKDSMLAGNVYQALQGVEAVGSDRQWAGSCYTPSILIDQLPIICQ
jgi:PmbA protein